MLVPDPAEFHPYVLCALMKTTGDSHRARVNLAAALEYARSDDPNTRRHVDEFLARVEKEEAPSES
jgi:hypothetical protein